MQSSLRSLAVAILLTASTAATAQIAISYQIGKQDTPVLGQPFTADVTIHTLRHLGNGLVVTRDVKGSISRTADGVERYEGIFPSTDPAHPEPTHLIYIIDRFKRTSVLLNSTRKTAVRQPMPPVATVTVSLLPLQTAGPHIKLEDTETIDLGKKNLGMLEITGHLLRGDIPVGKLGNDQPLPVTTEVWVAPQMKLIVSEIEKNPQFGERDLELANIRGEEPNPTLFQIPDDYTITDRATMPMPMLPGVIRALRETQPPPVPQKRTKQIDDALSNPNPVLKNNVAYALSQNNDHLTDALLLTQQALQIEEQQVADSVSSTDPEKSFDQMVRLSRFWDTSGFVYYHALQYAKAEAYLRAAWELNPNSVFATHLGRAYQSDRKFPQAVAMYRMALSARPSPTALDAIQSQLAKLDPTNSGPLPIDIATPLPTLTLTLPSDDDPPLVDIVLSRDHAPSVTWRKGDKSLREPVTRAIQTALASALPDDGPESVVRQAQLACDTTACSLHFTNTREFTAAELALRRSRQ